MAAIHDLLAQVQDEALRSRLEQEINRLNKNKKFGLVFEEHLPEYTPLYDLPIKKGSVAAKKDGSVSETYKVMGIADGMASCCAINSKNKIEKESIPVNNLVAVAQFGEPIYPFLKPVDSICNAPDSDLWHTLIEADNYHALQLLEYLYAGKVDCIYIDPPYNTGARDWKYNNNYVDGNDAYRHSKWLSFMKKRLLLAKKLLNPNGSALIVTIDDKEYLHLGCLLEDVFQGQFVQSVASVINPSGKTGKGFSVVHEYIFVVFIGNQKIVSVDNDDMLLERSEKYYGEALHWEGFLRGGTAWSPAIRPNLFYPIYVNPVTLKIEAIGKPTEPSENLPLEDGGLIVAWPTRKDGSFAIWRLDSNSLENKVKKGYAYCASYNKKKKTCAFKYLMEGDEKRIENGTILTHYDESLRHVVSESDYTHLSVPKSIWNRGNHNAGQFGSNLLTSFIGKRFSFPKSLYAVKDTIRLFVANKPNALIVDFFAGSGTTLHAVNLLNAEDGGQRRCILVTNNEMTGDEAAALKKQGILPGTEAYNARGIARYVTWPRTVCSVKGVNINGQPLSGEYITTKTEEKESKRVFTQLSFVSDLAPLNDKQKKQIISLLDGLPQTLVSNDCPFIVSEEHEISILFDDSRLDDYLDALDGQEHIKEFFIVTSNNKLFKKAKEQISDLLGTYKETVPVARPMSEGFKANAVFFQLGFLDKNSVEIGRSFRELLPILWMKAGCKNRCPVLEDGGIPDWLILPENRFAVLINESKYTTFTKELRKSFHSITNIYLVTDSDDRFDTRKNDLRSRFAVKNIIQLYRDYLDNFKINIERFLPDI